MKVLLTAGGGGHFAAAHAVIEKLPKDVEILVVGRKHSFEGDKALSLEYQICKEKNIPFVSLTTGRLQRKFSAHTLPSLAKAPYGILQSFAILRKFKPDVVLSFGGYISLPIVFIAHFLRIPIVIHEQTFGAGKANKIAAKFATKICISWESSKDYFPKEKVVMTGNPLREFTVHSSQFAVPEGSLPLVFITGGSGGAHAINLFIEKILPDLLDKYRVVHQTGDAQKFHDFEKLEEKVKTLPETLQKRYKQVKFLNAEDFSTILQIADVVIGRCGIGTVTMLAAYQKKAVLIPFPFGQNNEQLTNAQFLEKEGLVLIIEQKNLQPELFFADTASLLSKKIEKVPDLLRFTKSADTIIQVLYEVFQKTKKND